MAASGLEFFQRLLSGYVKYIEAIMSSPNPYDSIVRFSVFELDFQGRVLRKHGMRIRCQGQPLRYWRRFSKNREYWLLAKSFANASGPRTRSSISTTP